MVRYAQRANVRIKGERWIETPAGSLFLNGAISSAAWAQVVEENSCAIGRSSLSVSALVPYTRTQHYVLDLIYIFLLRIRSDRTDIDLLFVSDIDDI